MTKRPWEESMQKWVDKNIGWDFKLKVAQSNTTDYVK